ncbi:MAG: TauD/TfdA family dioxygenase, partial [Alphaproteobacteria bacterium]
TALEDGEMWFHGDQCYYEVPARASMLYAMEIPPVGGNTLFTNNYLSWETLPDGVRDKLDGLKAHNIYDYAGNPTVRGEKIDPNAPQHSHPVARTHPETGRKALYVNRLMTDYIEGIPREESDALLKMLFDHGEERRFVYEHVWRVGDLLMWDNRCSNHARTFFDPAHRRMMRRITVKGELVI